jgi:hypothetical protein
MNNYIKKSEVPPPKSCAIAPICPICPIAPNYSGETVKEKIVYKYRPVEKVIIKEDNYGYLPLSVRILV